MSDFSNVLPNRVPACGTAWLIAGIFVPIWSCKGKKQPGVVMAITCGGSVLEGGSNMFPRFDRERSYPWGRPFFGTKDGRAYIGHSRELPYAYLALGDGNRLRLSFPAAKNISDLHVVGPNPGANLFQFDT